MSPLPLIFQIKHIGDFLNTLPALGFMKKNFPGQPLGIVLSPKLAELALAHPWVDKVFVLDRSLGFNHLRRLSAEIRHSGYQGGLVFDGQTRSIVTAVLAGLTERVGSSELYPIKGWQRLLYTGDMKIEESPLALAQLSQAEKGVKLAAAALGLESEKGFRPPMPEVGSINKSKADELLSLASGDGPLIGLALQGLQAEKSWPLRYFASLAKKLYHQFQARLFVTGGLDEKEAAGVLAKASGAPVADFCGETNLLDLVALADKSDLFITIDTGTSHLVALTETPLVGIFVWTNPALWAPQSPHLRVLCYDWALARFGLSEKGPWLAAPVITPEMVFGEAASLLSR